MRQTSSRRKMMTDAQAMTVRQMRDADMGYGAIADYLGICKGTVKTWCRRHGLDGFRARTERTTTVQKPKVTVLCRHCGKPVPGSTKGRPRIYCSAVCRASHWRENACLVRRSKTSYRRFVCANCGRTFKVYGTAARKYCSHECYINDRYYRSTTRP